MNISSVIMNTSINYFREKKNEHQHNKYSIVYKECYRYSIEMYTSYGLESRGIIFKGKHTHINIKPTFFCDSQFVC
jgi:hypothetical protein